MLKHLEKLGIKPSKKVRKYLEDKPIKSYTIPTIDAINLISRAQYPKLLPSGSYIYKIQRFPGDIDLREQISLAENGDPIKKMVKIIQKIFRKAKKQTIGKSDFFLGEFKAGEDTRLEPLEKAMGKIENNKIIGYNSKKVLYELNKLLSIGIISDNRYKKMKELVTKSPSLLNYRILEKMIHKKKTIRWFSNEIEDGYRILPPNKKITLYQALKMKAVVKMDLWYWLYGRYTEISNFFRFVTKNKSGKLTSINLPDPGLVSEKDKWNGMVKQFTTLMYDKFKYNPFKALKRMWNMSFVLKDDRVSILLSDLMNSGYSILYQIVGDLNIAYELVSRLHAPPFDNLVLEIDEMKDRLSSIFEFDLGGIFNKLDKLIFGSLYDGDGDNVLVELTDIINYLSNILNRETITWLKKNRIIPFDKQYIKKI